MPPDKPRTRHGYTSDETELVKSALLLSLAVTLGAYMNDLCVVGGLDFGPDRNKQGNPSLQCWTDRARGITIDFLLPPTEEGERPGRIQKLESDFGALVTRGLELAFDERLSVSLRGRTLRGEAGERPVPVCGPGAFTVLKALAFGDRGEPKDAFDLVYVLRRWPAGIDDVANRLVRHAARHAEVVEEALTILRRDFETIDMIGSARAAEFEGAADEAAEELAADAVGTVEDLLNACVVHGLGAPRDAPPASREQSTP